MSDEDLLQDFARLSSEVRHPVLELGLFSTTPPEMPEDDGEVLRDPPAEELEVARLRRGALLAAANLLFDQVVDDLLDARGPGADTDEDDDESRFVDLYLPRRYRHAYDHLFQRKLLATIGHVTLRLGSPTGGMPGCTAEELVTRAVLRQWATLLEITDLGVGWMNLTDLLLADSDYEYLFAYGMDGIEDDPLAHKTMGIDVARFAEWFVPFSSDDVVSPYTVDSDAVGDEIYDLTHAPHAAAADHLASPGDGAILGFDPVSSLVAEARAHAQATADPGLWVPDPSDPGGSLAAGIQTAGSGYLVQQTGPQGGLDEVPVLSFTPHAAHRATGQAWADVGYFAGRSELPIAAVVSFRPDPDIRTRWRQQLGS